VALADKIDTLTGFWAIDEKPTGSKDPYALRRAALGVIRLVLGNGDRANLFEWFKRSNGILVMQAIRRYDVAVLKDADIQRVLQHFARAKEFALETQSILNALPDLSESERLTKTSAFSALVDANSDVQGRFIGLSKVGFAESDLLAFLHDRLKVHLRDEGIRHDVIDACLSSNSGAPAGATPGNDDLTLLVHRATALSDFLKTEDGENLLQGFKRANNILTQAEDKDGVEYSFGADVKFAETDAEKALFAALDTAEPQITAALEQEDFAAAMSAMAGLRAPTDAFFDAVQVNVDSPVIRRNRLNLLSRIRTVCLQAADLTRVEG